MKRKFTIEYVTKNVVIEMQIENFVENQISCIGMKYILQKEFRLNGRSYEFIWIKFISSGSFE